jgi:hypothetical protein
MLVSLVVRINVLDVLLTFWPVVLIFLGIEILLRLFGKNAGGDLKYDGLSILFIGCLLALSIGFYALTYYAGLFGSRGDVYSAFGILNETVFAENSETLSGTSELVVFDRFDRIMVLAAADGVLKIDYSVSAGTNDRETYTEAVLSDVVQIEPGERAYLRSDSMRFRDSARVGWPMINCVIYLPPDATVDLSQFEGVLEYDKAIEGQIIFA